jgi:hypothetical protein
MNTDATVLDKRSEPIIGSAGFWGHAMGDKADSVGPSARRGTVPIGVHLCSSVVE